MCKLECASEGTSHQVYGLTDIGRVRRQNQDSFYIDEERALFIVADGMGGHKAGDVASRTIVEALPGFILDALHKEDTRYSLESIQEILLESIRKVNERVFSLSLLDPDLEGMGSTLVMAFETCGTVFLVHVGDSRAYLVRNGIMRQITWDHSLVAEMVKLGQISEEEAWRHPRGNIITRAIGTINKVEPEVASYNALKSDVLLLCTDGLSDMVHKNKIAEIMLSGWELDRIVSELVTEALAAGGKDNITAVAVKWL